jgi:hypothetical protein
MAATIDILLRGRNQTDPAFGQVKKNIEEVKASAKAAVSQGLTPFNNALSTLTANIATEALGRLAGAMKSLVAVSIGAASDAEETAAAFDVAFGEVADSSRETITKLAADMNRSKYEFMESALSFQSIFVPMGWARGEAAKMSTSLTTLVSDVASFRNANEADVQTNFLSGIVGEHEALRKYGIVITETSLKQELAKIGAEEATGAALEQAKIQARLNLIFQATSDAQGDAIRTASSYSNTMRGLQAAILDLRVGVGAAILPALTGFMGELVEVVRNIGPATIGFFTGLAQTLSTWAKSVDLSGWLTGFINGIIDAGNVVRTFLAILMGEEFRNNNFADLFEYLPKPMQAVAFAITNAMYAVKDFLGWVWKLLEPVREWIAKNIQLSDFLIALGGYIAWIAGSPVITFLAGFGKIALILGALTLAVAAVRLAWETDFLGIRTAFEKVAGVIDLAWRNVKSAFAEYGGGAITELKAFLTGNETQFTNLNTLFWRVVTSVTVVFRAIRDAIVEILGNVLTKLGEWGGALIAWAAKAAPGWITAMGKFATAAWEWLTLKVIPATATMLGGWWLAISTWASATLPKWGAALASWGVAAWSWIKDTAIPGVSDWLAKLWGSISGWATTNLPNWGRTIGGWAAGTWAWLRDDAIPGITTWLGNLWRTMYQWATNNLPGWLTQMGIWASAAWNWIRDTAIPKVGEWLRNLWIGISDWATKNLPLWVKKLGEWALAAWKWIEDVTPKAINTLAEWGGWLLIWLRDNLPKWVEKLSEWAVAAYVWLRDEAIPELNKWLNKMWDDYILPFLTVTLPLWIKELAKWAQAGWVWIRDTLIPNTIAQMKLWAEVFLGPDQPGGKVAAWLRTTFPGATMEAIEAWERLSARFAEVVAEIKKVFGSGGKGSASSVDLLGIVDFTFTLMLDRISTKVDALLLTMKAFLLLMQGEWGLAWEALVDIEEGKTQLLMRNTAAFMQAQQGTWKKGAEQQVAGYVEGMVKEGHKAREAVEELDERMKRQFEDDFGIRSPSTVTKGYGINVVKGFGEGLSDWPSISSVLSAARKLATDAINAIKQAAGVRSPSTYTYDTGKNIVLGTVNGVLDYAGLLASAMSSLGLSAMDSLASSIDDGSSAAIRSLDELMASLTAKRTAMMAEATAMANQVPVTPGSTSTGIPVAAGGLSAGGVPFVAPAKAATDALSKAMFDAFAAGTVRISASGGVRTSQPVTEPWIRTEIEKLSFELMKMANTAIGKYDEVAGLQHWSVQAAKITESMSRKAEKSVADETLLKAAQLLLQFVNGVRPGFFQMAFHEQSVGDLAELVGATKLINTSY